MTGVSSLTRISRDRQRGKVQAEHDICAQRVQTPTLAMGEQKRNIIVS